MKKGLLVLEDGTAWEGVSSGASGEFAGEVIFYTGVVGYQEVLTDPAYSGSIAVMTYPHIGNYGINREEFASDRTWVKGIVVKEVSRIYSNWQAYEDLTTFARKNGVFILSGVDTQNIARHLRIHGFMKGAFTDRRINKKTLLAKLKSLPPAEKMAAKASCRQMYVWPNEEKKALYKVAVIDLGLNRESLKQLSGLGATAEVFPFNAGPGEILSRKPDGIFLAGGPGEPSSVMETAGNLKALIPEKPVLGVGLGFQVLCLSLGAKSFRMKCGHYGLNQPVKDLVKNRCLSTKQNHLFAIDADSLGGDIALTHINLNDQTVEGIVHKKFPVLGVQYCPGQTDSIFQKFIGFLKKDA